MTYVELRSFMKDIFPGRDVDILNDALSQCEIVDIDIVSKEKKKEFADYILKKHLHFSPQRNRYLYDNLLNTLGVGSLFDLTDYRKIEKEVKIHENIILSSFQIFWNKVHMAYRKYEMILNLFWLKGVEAELRGADKEYVTKIIKKALIRVQDDLQDAFEGLMKDLDLNRYKKKKKLAIFKIKLFDEVEYPQKGEEPDEDTKYLLVCVHSLKDTVQKSYSYIEELLLTSLDREFALRKSGVDDEKFVEDIKKKILTDWDSIKEKYDEVYRGLEEKFKE